MPISLVGCQGNPTVPESKGRTRSDIVDGTASTASQDATVLVVRGQGACTGTLIAPNLVLTARHCVAEPRQEGETDCVSYGPTASASEMEIYLGVDAQPGNGSPDAVGSKISVPQTSNMCGFDVALVQLDRELKGAKTAKVRFTELAPNEKTLAVGYGVDGQDQQNPSRMQRSTTVLGVGPKALQYKTKDGQTVTYDLPKGDVATGESTCYGDSGGPLYDSQGAVVALTSRGIPFEDDGSHGNGCIDLPSIYAGVRFNEQLIRQAAKAAGHPLPEEKTEPPPATKPDDATGGGANTGGDGTTGPSPTPKKTGDDAAGAGEPSGGDDDDDKSSKPKKSEDDGDEGDGGDDDADDSKASKDKGSPKSSNGVAPAASSGCSATGAGAGSGSWLAILGVALAVGATRRRSARR